MKLYIAHPFDSRKKVKKWINEFSKKTKHKLINPFYPQREFEVFKDEDISSNEYYEKLKFKEIVEDDIKLIKECDAMIAIIDGALSYGTIQEIIYAHINHKSIYLIVTNGHEKHPWLLYHATKIFTSFKEIEKYINYEDLIK